MYSSGVIFFVRCFFCCLIAFHLLLYQCGLSKEEYENLKWYEKEKYDFEFVYFGAVRAGCFYLQQ